MIIIRIAIGIYVDVDVSLTSRMTDDATTDFDRTSARPNAPTPEQTNHWLQADTGEAEKNRQRSGIFIWGLGHEWDVQIPSPIHTKHPLRKHGGCREFPHSIGIMKWWCLILAGWDEGKFSGINMVRSGSWSWVWVPLREDRARRRVVYPRLPSNWGYDPLEVLHINHQEARPI